MKRISSVLVVLLGLILLLPLVGVTQFGTLIEGMFGWATAIFVLVIGAIEIFKAFKE